jgi:PmbA protein
VSRGGETEVRVYQGEVEHFVSAQAEGIGIRVVRDGRTGFAYAGTLDERGDRRGARRGPRQPHVRHRRRVGRVWPSPTASPSPTRRCGATSSPSTRPTARSSSPGARAARHARSTRACGSTTRTTPTRPVRRPWPRPPASAPGGRENGCYVSVSTLADDGDETQTGSGSASGARPPSSTSRRPPATRPIGRPGCSAPPSRRAAPHDRARPDGHGPVPVGHLGDAQR